MIYAELAHRYLRAGYSPLPLPPRAKKSPPDDWTGEDAPMASGGDVQAWIETAPDDANIALRVPANVVVLDVDNHKHPAQQTMMKAIEALGPLPVIGRSSARDDDPVSGHRLFRIPEGVKLVGNLKSAGFGDGVDIIQHHHRYIVAPGSVHPDGGVYRWYGESGFPSVDELPELPTAWLEGLQQKAAPARTYAEDRSGYLELPDEERAGVDRYIEATLSALWSEMEAMKSWKEGQTDHHGGWEDGMMARTMRLATLVVAPWSPLTRDGIIEKLAAHAPRSDDFPLPTTISKFVRALEKAEPADPPTGGRDTSSWFTNTLAEARHVGPETTPEVAESWPIRIWGESGNIERTLEAADGRLVYVESVGWLEYADGIWSQSEAAGDPDSVPAAWVGRALETAREREGEKYDDENQRDQKGGEKEGTSERAKFRKWIDGAGSGTHTAAAKTMRRRARDFDLEVSASRLDAEPYDLAVLNGIVDLRTGELREATKGDFITKQAPVTYRPGAARPYFERFLASSLPDPEIRDYLQRIIGYSATGMHAERAMFIHHGPETANGKSSLFNALKNVFGPHYGAASSKALLWSRNEKTGQDFIDLIGYRFLALSETPEGSRLDEAVVKSLTSGDWRADRAHFRGNTQYRVTGKIHVSTNHLPHSTPDDAMRARVHIVQWLESFVGAKADPHLEEKLASESEGILAWVVEGAARWYADWTSGGTGLVRPLTSTAALEDFFHDEDDVARWLADRAVPVSGDADWTPIALLYSDYDAWMHREGERVVKTRSKFTRHLSKLLNEKSTVKRVDGTPQRSLPLKIYNADQRRV